MEDDLNEGKMMIVQYVEPAPEVVEERSPTPPERREVVERPRVEERPSEARRPAPTRIVIVSPEEKKALVLKMGVSAYFSLIKYLTACFYEINDFMF